MIAGHLNQPSKPGHSVTFSIPKASHSPKPVPVPQSVHRVPGSPTPSTIRRRSGLSLHRAVVLRSAQRAQRERERHEEQQEEDEVEAEVSPERDLGPLEVSKGGEHDEDEEHGQPVSPSVGSSWLHNREGKCCTHLSLIEERSYIVWTKVKCLKGQPRRSQASPTFPFQLEGDRRAPFTDRGGGKRRGRRGRGRGRGRGRRRK